HVAVEGQVDVDHAVAGAVERPDGGVRGAARRIDLVAEQDQRRFRVGLAHAAEQLVPDLLGVAEDDLGEGGHLLLFRVGGRGVAWARPARARRLPGELRELLRVHAEEQGDEGDQDAAPAERQAGLRGERPAVLYVFTLLTALPFHGCHLRAERESG